MIVPEHDLAKLQEILASAGQAAIAVSGGVDSMTLAIVAHRLAPARTHIFHATSPAVPELATDRVRDFAAREGWDLNVIDAGEFQDPEYRANPADRCYFCKRGLYGGILKALQAGAEHALMAGTNLDDLGDFRPGLLAAEQKNVRHPFVEAGMTKSQVRAVAAHLGLQELAELAAAPCLASRVETGLAIDGDELRKIDRVEVALRANLKEMGLRARAVRCRVLSTGIELALDTACLDALDAASRARLLVKAQRAWGQPAPSMKWSAYQMGQTFFPSAETRARYASSRVQVTPAESR
ncbi:MAG: hypothetical protein ACI9D0_001458 [Bacteroidia bacterium]